MAVIKHMALNLLRLAKPTLSLKTEESEPDGIPITSPQSSNRSLECPAYRLLVWTAPDGIDVPE